MKKIMKERVGMVFSNTFGTKYEVIEYERATKVTIKFLDEYGFTTTTQWHCVESGWPRNPYDRVVAGVGYLGISPITGDIQKADGKAYKCWADMINRCYNPKITSKKPTYAKCTVCERWHCFVNFLEDIKEIQGYEQWINNKGWELDKDIKQPNVEYKIYSKETCIFITTSENTKESGERANHMSKGLYLEKDGIYKYFPSKTKAAKFLGVSRIQTYHEIINGYKIIYEK